MDDAKNTKIQYIMVDSDLVSDPSSFTLDLNQESNLHCEGINQVIGIKLVDFYITQVGSSGSGTGPAAKYIDILCKDIPKVAQILDERNGQTFARIPLERAFYGSSSFKQHDKQWFPFERKTTLFNPINIQKLNFDIKKMRGDDEYRPLGNDSSWYMILEIITRVEREESKPEEQDEEEAKKEEESDSKVEKYTIHGTENKAEDVDRWNAIVSIIFIILVGFVLLLIPKRKPLSG